MTAEFLRWLVREAVAGDELATVPRRVVASSRCAPCIVEAMLPVVEQALTAGEYKVDGFLPKVPTRYVAEEEIRRGGIPDDIFRNVNTPEDFELLKRMLEGSRDHGVHG